jgi:hypothetical protein
VGFERKEEVDSRQLKVERRTEDKISASTDRSKRDSSTARADAFAGANAKKRHRPASVGMTG